jgi:chemotaxis protein methyltransferase CheR/type IV pilus assembly protein PilK
LTSPALQQLDDRQFAAWRELLEHRVGLYIAPERRSFLVSGLRARMKQNGCQSAQQYYQQLEISGSAQAQEWSLLVDCLTVHESSFFRHASSMRLVRETILPEARKNKTAFMAWSVGCATGEEAYSLAMHCADCAASVSEHEFHYGVTGTDISLPSLRSAKQSVYLRRRLKDIPERYQHEYCEEESANHFRIKEPLRKRVCFSQLNLRDLAAAHLPVFDLIYCQNLLIYYARQHRHEIVNALTDFVTPGGYLIVGPGELLGWQHTNMEKVCYTDTLAFRRAD